MANVLMGWELGEGLGHVQKLLWVARALKDQGHRPIFALFNLIEPWPLFRGTGFAFVQAPFWHPRTWRGERPFAASTFADVLAIRGWESVDSLLAMVTAWQQVIDLVQPALIVADFSPTLCLAAFRTIPVVLVGSWFSLPPGSVAGFPILVPGQAPVMPQEQMLALVQEVQCRRQRPIPATLPEILAAADCFPTVFPELDPYLALRPEPTWDPLDPLPEPMPPPSQPQFFAYLTAENAQTEAFLTEMALTGCRGTVYLRSAFTDVQERLRLQGLNVLDKPAPMVEMLAQASVVVHHGGLGTTHLALAAGRPQILIPQHFEQFTGAQLLHRLGVAINLVGNVTPQGLARALQRICEGRFADKAIALARSIHGRPRRHPMPAILERCRRHLG